MIFLPQRGSLSRRMSGYVVASTDNPTGWRPDYRRLGSDGVQDWKAAAAARDARARAQMWFAAAQQNAAMQQVARNDAWARGDRTPYRMTGLGSLGASFLQPTAQMVMGAPYVFYFSGSSIAASITSMDSIRSKISADTNFLNPVATPDGNGFHVSFTYNGQGSTVGNAGSEMQSVLNHWSLNPLEPGVGYTFNYASGGPALSSTGQVLLDANGNPIPDPSAVAPQPPGPGFDLSTFLAGLSTGGAVALGLGVLLLLKGI